MLLDVSRDFCSRFGRGGTYWVALSGGMDSLVLLSLWNTLRNELELDLRVIHVNHGLSPHAGSWAHHCREAARQYGLNLVERSLHLILQPGESPEDAARRHRYAVFAELIREGDILLTAHHQDDQAETVLLQLLRGAGPKGLSAMPVIKPFAKGFHGRPLLQVPRISMRQYAEKLGLKWINDESNEDRKFARNFLRHEIMPRLISRWPSAAASLARSAAHCAEQHKLLDDFLLDSVSHVQGTRPGTLSVTQLLQFSPEKQRLILRSWINLHHCPLPDTKKLYSIQHSVLNAAWDRSPCVRWGRVSLRRHRDDLFLLTATSEFDASRIFTWDLSDTLFMHGIGKLHAKPVCGQGLSAAIRQVTVRCRQGGEKIELPARGRRALKNLFQEWQVVPWERNSIPLIYVGNDLVAVAGYFLHEEFTARAGEPGRELLFERQGTSM
ncbi:tRNA(Ile)-lysidine synthase [Aquicella siphonis]|uniref:tRNA(Ile)-lysidine synthase n=1 Tax=Aquicella siphonis TaxID=254247 RepID=A0A5E4PGS2_9COXI|nr:tRNA lysidine(34) synthetase TilS [Aquicella siphonis]VVC75785.1 tRNA(Ile)-lysidine synthase [Aquicella siphonis]